MKHCRVRTERHKFQTAQELWAFLNTLKKEERDLIDFDMPDDRLTLYLDTQTMSDGSRVLNIRIEP